MQSIFQSSSWQLAVPVPWKAAPFEDCVELTQPEGTGALHISSYVKQAGNVLDNETRERLQRDCPDETELEPVRLGDFTGYGADYIDWNEGTYWKRWLVAFGRVMLLITYNCKRGQEDLEITQIENILSSLRQRQR